MQATTDMSESSLNNFREMTIMVNEVPGHGRKNVLLDLPTGLLIQIFELVAFEGINILVYPKYYTVHDRTTKKANYYVRVVSKNPLPVLLGICRAPREIAFKYGWYQPFFHPAKANTTAQNPHWEPVDQENDAFIYVNPQTDTLFPIGALPLELTETIDQYDHRRITRLCAQTFTPTGPFVNFLTNAQKVACHVGTMVDDNETQQRDFSWVVQSVIARYKCPNPGLLKMYSAIGERNATHEAIFQNNVREMVLEDVREQFYSLYERVTSLTGSRDVAVDYDVAFGVRTVEDMVERTYYNARLR